MMKIFVVIFCLLSLAVLAILPVLAGERVPSRSFTREDCKSIMHNAPTSYLFARESRKEVGLALWKELTQDILNKSDALTKTFERGLVSTARWAPIYASFCKP